MVRNFREERLTKAQDATFVEVLATSRTAVLNMIILMVVLWINL